MTPTTRLLFTPVLLLAVVATATAQDFSTTTAVFAFAPKPGKDVVADANKELNATEDLTLRPNGAAEFYLYAFNPAKVEKTYTVELKGGRLTSQAKVKIPAEKWKRVVLPPPAPPAPTAPVVAAPAPVAPAANQPAPVPPPPGTPLLRTDGRFQFTLRLLTEDGSTPVKDAAGNDYGHAVTVSILRPEAYIAAPSGIVTRGDTLTRVTVNVAPLLDAEKKPLFAGPADVRLSFPPQPALTGAVIREGVYRRTLDPSIAPQATLSGAVENAGEGVRVQVGVDGYDRAFIYEPYPVGDVNEGRLNRVTTRAVRVYPATGFATTAATQPVAAFPVRVEADNAPADATLELWIRPARAGDSPAVNEVVRLVGGARDERVWVDLAGPTDQGVFVSDRSRDWVAPLDLSALRGEQEVVAVLTVPGAKGAVQVKSPPLRLTIDATPPDRIAFARLPEKHVKGKPLPVKVTATDPETKVTKAVFFLGKPTDEGQIPADAVKVEGVQSAENPADWTAEIPLPPEKRGEAVIGVVFTNAVGLATTRTQRIELVDAPPPAGAIDGVVKIGEIPQAGVVVSLRNADGKELATTKTAEKADEKQKIKVGDYHFENVAPGNYTVAAGKASSSYPFAGSAPVQVEVGKRSKAPAIAMIKQVK